MLITSCARRLVLRAWSSALSRRACFTGVLNSTSKVVITAMRRGLSRSQGLEEARTLGITEADPSYDIDGWDSAVKTAALANVLFGARVRPRDVEREGIRDITPEYVQSLARDRKQICLVSRAEWHEWGGGTADEA